MKRFLCCLLAFAAVNGLAMEEKGRGYLGVNIGTEGQGKDQQVVRISKVYKNSGAEAAGLKSGDVILQFQGVEIATGKELTEALDNYAPGDVVSMVVLRDDKEVSMDVELQESSRFNFRFGDKWLGYLNEERAYVGVELMELNDQLAAYFGVESGVMIKRVSEGTPAATAGLKAGDIITRFGGENIQEHHQINKTLAQYKPGDVVTVDVMRRGKNKSFKVTTEGRKAVSFNVSPNIHVEGLETLKHLNLEELKMDGMDFKNFKFEFDSDKLRGDLEKMKIELEKMKKELKKHKKDQ